MLVVDKCKEKKEKLHYTFEQISELSGIPLSTVYSFFKETSQNPSYITVGAICKVLGISLDAILGIEDEEMSADEIARVREESKKNEEALQLTIQEHAQNIMRQEAEIDKNLETIRRQDLRMKELNDANAWLNDRAEYQIKWLRFLSVGLFSYSLLITVAILILLFRIIPMIQAS